jgi:hypothetical protein
MSFNLSGILLLMIASPMAKYEIIQYSLYGAIIASVVLGVVSFDVAEWLRMRMRRVEGDFSVGVQAEKHIGFLAIPAIGMLISIAFYFWLKNHLISDGTYVYGRMLTRILCIGGLFWAIWFWQRKVVFSGEAA